MSRLFVRVPFCASLLLSSAALAETLPPDTKLELRLQTRVASTSKVGDKFEAAVVAPVVVDGAVVIPLGSRVTGSIKAATPVKPNARADLTLEFTGLACPSGPGKPLASKLVQVDNARESVDADGRILGILESETLTARADKGIEKVATKYSGFADILSALKGAVLQKADTEISYDAGTDLEVALTKPLDAACDAVSLGVLAISPENDLYSLVNSLPFQTTAEKPPKPSDLTTLMFLGTRDQVAAAFAAAGWSTAEERNAVSGLETARAVAEQRGYKEAPMSTLLLDGQRPDIVFQKQLNTFAKRHHLRIFHRPEKFQEREIWVCAATHDIGIDFSPENRTFIHKIDSSIDTERAKVVFDLMYAGQVAEIALVDRPKVPRQTGNATGDKIETDGKMAVLLLK